MEFANPAIRRMPAEQMSANEEAEGFVRRVPPIAALSGVVAPVPQSTVAGPFDWAPG
jgi:hypothetical protein